ncbi:MULTISPECIES: trypsin-like serine peptidase [Pseudonocardia]|uniref:trypsin-like serine peptidase n=1 Tax=Pseudonocardia TaxID=1847 RepID=UPI0005A1C48C|nr:serine protease [Pseudonocardia dioxanivorans]
MRTEGGGVRGRPAWAVTAGVVVCLAVVVCLVVVAASGTASGSPAAPAPQLPAATPAHRTGPAAVAGVAWPAVGAIFDAADVGSDGEGWGEHFCSGAVVDTPAGDTVMTAAHCVADGDGTPARTDLVFVPGYHDGVAPFGIWTVRDTAVDPRWVAAADPDLDVAFLAVGRDGAGPIQDVTGGYRLAIDPGDGGPVQVVGYPEDAAGPVAPTGVATRFSPTQLQLADADLPGGTSGGPWLRDGTRIIGVTGGYQQGGESDDVSYASYLDADTVALLATLTAA